MSFSQRLVLVSVSPRRRDLLSHLTNQFETAISNVEESGGTALPDHSLPPLQLPPPFQVPHNHDPRLWAWRKAHDYCSHQRPSQVEQVILSADTVVVAHAEILNKPVDEADALRMLKLLRGRSHYVVTGYCVLKMSAKSKHNGPGPHEVALDATITEVVMRPASDDDLMRYVSTGEPLDKAGAYAVQGEGGTLISEVRGCYTNVVGLPLCRVRAVLERAGVDLGERPQDGYCSACTRNNFRP